MKKQTNFIMRCSRAMRLSWIGLIALSMASTSCKKQAAAAVAPETTLVHVAVAEPADAARTSDDLSYLAVVRAEKETDLSFKVGGIIERLGPAAGVDWDEGTAVKAGTELATLSQSDFANALTAACARADLATKTLERFKKLRATDAIAQQELDVAESNEQSANAQKDAAEQNVRDSKLYAATDGVILARYVNAHATAGAGQRVLRFADTRVMSVELGLPDTLVAELTPGAEVDVQISALEGHAPFRGRVSEVGVAANAESRLYRIVVKVPNPDGILRSGMTARIRLGKPLPLAAGAVRIPLSALITLSASTATNTPPSGAKHLGVFVAQNGRVSQRVVKTGDLLGSAVVVTEGLRSGEQVVTTGASFLYDGAKIEVVPDDVER
jgi:RND family efflux transporter MFP subunit